jgi:hypothetical protein
MDQVDEGCGAAVHDGDFGSVELDEGVVDAQDRQSCEEMFHRLDPHALSGEAGRVIEASDML